MIAQLPHLPPLVNASPYLSGEEEKKESSGPRGGYGSWGKEPEDECSFTAREVFDADRLLCQQPSLG